MKFLFFQQFFLSNMKLIIRTYIPCHGSIIRTNKYIYSIYLLISQSHCHVLGKTTITIIIIYSNLFVLKTKIWLYLIYTYREWLSSFFFLHIISQDLVNYVDSVSLTVNNLKTIVVFPAQKNSFLTVRTITRIDN